MILVNQRVRFVFRRMSDGEWQEQLYTREGGVWLLRHMVWNMTKENVIAVVSSLKEIGFTDA